MRSLCRLGCLLFASSLLVLGFACGDDPSPSPPGAIGEGGEGGGAGRAGDIPAPCDDDEQCPASKPYCGSEGCQGCLQDDHCPLGAPACTGGVCSPCTGDEACEGRGRCELEEGACVECLDAEDCEEGLCSEDHRCVECSSDEDCRGSYICDREICLAGDRCTPSEPCEEDRLCFIENRDARFGICREQCDVETQEGCEEGLVCELHSFGEDFLPRGGCVEPTGGAQAGEKCSETILCDSHLICVNSFGRTMCAEFCDPDVESSCTEELVCEALGISSIPQAKLHVCVPEERPCTSSRDCREDEACSLFGGGGVYFQLCAEKEGEKEGGAYCERSEECASGLCHTEDAVCWGGCEEEGDCAEGAVCLPLELGRTTIEGCVRSCKAERDCIPGSGCFTFWTASPTTGEIKWVNACNPTEPNGVPPGEACSGMTPCSSGQCVGVAAVGGYCRSPCELAEDCGSVTECVDTYWRESDVGGAPHAVNIPSCRGMRCERTGDCLQGWSCLPEDNGGLGGDGLLELRCRAGNVGAASGGHPCDGKCNCRMSSRGQGQVCFEPCTVDAECDAGMECVEGAFELKSGDGNISIFKGCLPLLPPE